MGGSSRMCLFLLPFSTRQESHGARGGWKEMGARPGRETQIIKRPPPVDLRFHGGVA